MLLYAAIVLWNLTAGIYSIIDLAKPSQVWASIEGGVQRALAQYAMTRFQKASKAR